jgi:hypothetical protein
MPHSFFFSSSQLSIRFFVTVKVCPLSFDFLLAYLDASGIRWGVWQTQPDGAECDSILSRAVVL